MGWQPPTSRRRGMPHLPFQPVAITPSRRVVFFSPYLVPLAASSRLLWVLFFTAFQPLPKLKGPRDLVNLGRCQASLAKPQGFPNHMTLS
jgi:hypothetical protein